MGRRQGPFPVQDSDGPGAVGGGVVDFCTPALSDAERLGAAAADQHRSVWKWDRKTVVVRIVHRHFVPGSACEVLQRFQRPESVRMAADDREFPTHHQRAMLPPGSIQTGQPLDLQGRPLRAVLPRGRVLSRSHGRAPCKQDGRKYGQRVFHSVKIARIPNRIN